MFKRTYKRNISPLAGLKSYLYLELPVFDLFFIQNGLSLLQIGLLESILLMGRVSCVRSHLVC